MGPCCEVFSWQKILEGKLTDEGVFFCFGFEILVGVLVVFQLLGFFVCLFNY